MGFVCLVKCILTVENRSPCVFNCKFVKLGEGSRGILCVCYGVGQPKILVIEDCSSF